MSVLVKGMDMPSECLTCPFKHMVGGIKLIGGVWHKEWYADCKNEFVETVYNTYSDPVRRSGKRPDCPLIEVPEPHGRLVDADALERNLIPMQSAQNNLVARGVRKSRGVLRNMQTVIPAEEGG